jgi:hypothetical protein
MAGKRHAFRISATRPVRMHACIGSWPQSCGGTFSAEGMMWLPDLGSNQGPAD